MKPDQPVGIFDSGIGGLTIAKAVVNLLPCEQIIFFGDTAHLPYGDKSAESIKLYSHHIMEFLLQKNCKAVIIACNTASASSFSLLKKEFGNKRIILNVIDPVVEAAVKGLKNGKIGVIGTKRTINSGIYTRKIKKVSNKQVNVSAQATSLLAPMIEEGFFNNNISQTIINSYLSKKSFEDIDAIILACTHYPLIKEQIRNYYNRSIRIIDSTDVMAQKLEEELRKKNLLSDRKEKPAHEFYVSDFTTSFQETTRIFFNEKVKLRYYPLWKNIKLL